MDAEAALSRAFDSNDHAAIASLINANVNVELPDKRHGMQTPLMRLCHLKMSAHAQLPTSDSLLQLLLSRSPDVNARDDRGCTAIAHACIAERDDIIAALSKVPYCDPNSTDNGGNSPLIYAVRSRRLHIVKAVLDNFLAKGLDINHSNRKGLCALQEAELRHDEDICRLLIELGGADVTLMKASSIGKHSARTPRCDTPDAKFDRRRGSLPSSQRRGSHSLTGEHQLSPLVTNGRVPIHVPTELETENVNMGQLNAVEDSSSVDGLAALLEEPSLPHNETVVTESVDAPTADHSSRYNSLSLPDLNVHNPGRSLRGNALHRGDGGSAENIRLTHEDVSLPLLCEAEEEEAEEMFAEKGEKANNCDRKSGIVSRQRHNSISLPDLRQQDTAVVHGSHQSSRHLPVRHRADMKSTLRASVQPEPTAVIDFLSVGGMVGGVLGLPRQNTSSQLAHNLPKIQTSRRDHGEGFTNRPLGEHKWSPLNHRRQTDISPSRVMPSRRYRTESKALSGLHLAGTKLKLSRSDQ